MLGIISTSNHFEWLSTTVRDILPINGPAKSMCTLCHGILGQSHGCKVAGWGLLRDFWQLSLFRTIVAISRSRLGHQTYPVPGCPVCNSYSTRSRSWLGIITQIPHNKQPSSTVISRRLLKYSVISGVICLSGQPVITYCSTLDKTGSVHVALRTWSTFIGKDSICNKLMSLTSSTSSFALSLCIGKRDKQAEFACFVVERYSISYWYAASSNAHLCNRAAARVGIPLFGPNNVVNGLWSVTKRNFFRTSIGEISSLRKKCWVLPFRSARNYARFWITYAKHRRSVALLRTVICARLLRRCHTVRRLCRVLTLISR